MMAASGGREEPDGAVFVKSEKSWVEKLLHDLGPTRWIEVSPA